MRKQVCLANFAQKFENRSDKSGMTLIEILVALALLSVIFGLIILPFTKSFDLVRRARVSSSLESAMMIALRQIERDISEARIIFLMKSPYDLQDGENGDDDSTGRIDIIPNNQDLFVKLGTPLIPQERIIAYYGKFRDPTKQLSMDPKMLNLRVLYRGEIELDRDKDGKYDDPDGDGKYGEDLNDRLDNDSDSKVDEDQPILENAITPFDGTDLAGLRFHYDNATRSIIADIKLQKIDPSVRAVRMPDGKIQPALLIIRRQIRIPLNEWTEVIYLQ